MAKVQDTFLKAINEGMAAARMIQDPAHKASAYAQLAHALAITGLVANPATDSTGSAEQAEEAAVPATPAKGKDSLKPDASKVKKEESVTPPAAPAAEAPEAEASEEWTEELITQKADQIEYISNLKNDYDENQLNQCVQKFSDGHLSTLDDISPLNIDAFVAFMQGLIAQLAADAQ